MRFLVSEKSYEKPVAAGLLRYARDGERTGTIESWRLSQTDSGEQILRVDLDARDNGGNSYLYHLLLDADGNGVRLVYRFLGDQTEVSGNVLFSADALLNTRTLGDQTFTEETAALPLLFPSTIGLGVLARAVRGPSAEVAMLNMHGEGNDFMQLTTQTMQFAPQRTRDFKRVTVGRSTHRATTLTVSWGDQKRKLWLATGNRWPLQMKRNDGLAAQETRYVRYG